MYLYKEYQKLNKLCDKIHGLFIKTDLVESKLNEICNKNNIIIDDYLYLQGYTNFMQYVKDINN